MKCLIATIILAMATITVGGCKEESKKTETTVTKPAGEAPAKVEEKTTTEEKE